MCFIVVLHIFLLKILMYNKIMNIDIVIPIHIIEFKYLEENLNSIKIQTFKNYTIIITDETETQDIYNFLYNFNIKNNLPIQYYKSQLKGWSHNHNNALRHCKSDLIKILHYDNYFYHENSLSEIIDAFLNNDIYWLITPYLHYENSKTQDIHFPKYTTNILYGNNRIGDPSCLTIKNKNIFIFNENLTWFVDCEYYYNLHNNYGEPYVLKNSNVVVRKHNKQTTRLCENNEELKKREREYLKQKYGLDYNSFV